MCFINPNILLFPKTISQSISTVHYKAKLSCIYTVILGYYTILGTNSFNDDKYKKYKIKGLLWFAEKPARF